jgi:hypothetical protein
MGAAAAREADVVVVTDDKPAIGGIPSAIRAALLDGAPRDRRRARRTVLEIGDRRAAVAEAVRLAWGDPRGAVLVAGKGHEHGQEVGGTVWPFDDREVLREALSADHTAGTVTGRGSRAGDRTQPRRGGRGHRWPVDRRRVAAGRGVRPGGGGLPAGRPGSLFAALAGERVDGHDFAASAAAAGCGRRARGPARSVVPAVLVDDVLSGPGAAGPRGRRPADRVRPAGRGGHGVVRKTSTKD